MIGYKLFGLLIAVLCSINTEAQKKSFSDYLAQDEKVKLETYWYIVSKKKDGRYVQRTFFPETVQITSEVIYSNKKLKTKQGEAIFWFENGNKSREGMYVNNKKVGHWIQYHRMTGGVASEGLYQNGDEHGQWKRYDDQGRLTEELNYNKGIKEGRFVTYDSLGVIKNEGVYKNDDILSQTMQPSMMDESKDHTETMPYLAQCKSQTDIEARKKCSDIALITFIQQNLKYPRKARENDLEGRAIVQFVVTKDGSVKDIETLVGLCQPIKDECERIVKRLPKWKPGIQDGEPVNVKYTVPFTFRLK